MIDAGMLFMRYRAKGGKPDIGFDCVANWIMKERRKVS